MKEDRVDQRHHSNYMSIELREGVNSVSPVSVKGGGVGLCDGAMVLATAFSIRADIPSGPVALVTSRLLNNLFIFLIYQTFYYNNYTVTMQVY